MTRAQQARASHRQRKRATLRKEAARYKDGYGKKRAAIARKLRARQRA